MEQTEVILDSEPPGARASGTDFFLSLALPFASCS